MAESKKQSKVRRNKWGQQLCKHRRVHSYCKDCKGNRICVHNKQMPSCRKCSKHSFCEHGRRNYVCKQCGGFPILADEMYRAAKNRAKRRNLHFNLTKEHLLELIGDGVCPILGFSYDLSSRQITARSASLDRIDSKRGYVKGNCAVISQLANAIKQNASAQQIFLVAEWVNKQEKVDDEF